MKTRTKLILIAAGYLLALVVALAAAYARDILVQDQDINASSGMSAFGDLLFFVAVFGFLLLAPTGALLVMSRRWPAFWTAVSLAAITIAVAGPPATIAAHHFRPNEIASGMLWLAQFLGAPLLAVGFFVVAVIAPGKRHRSALLAAGIIEVAVSGYSFLCLFVLQHWLI